MAAEAFIFDLDGTIWDSFPWYASILEVASGRPYEYFLAALMQGVSVIRLLNDAGITRYEFTRLMATYSATLAPYETATETVSALHLKNVPLAVHTSLPGTIALPMLEALGLHRYFRSIMHAGNSGARKPSSLGVVRALATLGTEPSAAVFYVGDRLVDAMTALNSRVSFAWASYGYVDGNPQYVNVELARPDQLLML